MNVQDALKDPDFMGLPTEEKRKALIAIDADFAGLPGMEQSKVLQHIEGRANILKPPASPVPEEGFSVGKTISNIPGSAVEFGKNIVGAVTSPVQTISNLMKTMRGAGVLAVEASGLPIPIPEEVAPMKEYAKEAGKMVWDRVSHPLQTIQNDPVGAAADVASLFTGGGAITRMVPGAGKLSNLMSVVGKTMEPVNLAAKVASPVVKPVANLGGSLAKKMMAGATGVSEGNIEHAIEASKPFVKNLRDATATGEDILTDLKTGMKTVRDNASQEYTQRLQTIRANQTQLQNVRNGLNSEANKLMGADRFDITPVFDQNGVLTDFDFSKSSIVDHVPAAKKALQDVLTWDDNTPAGLDKLKKRLSDFVAQTGQHTPAQSLVTSLRSNLDKGLKANVPGYQEMTQNYRVSAELLENLEKALSAGNQHSIDTALRKVTKLMKEDNNFRQSLVASLPNGEDIMRAVSGFNMRSYIPQSWLGRSVAAGEVMSSIYNPKYLLGLAAASPRITGEFLQILGRAAREYQKVKPPGMAPARLGAFQAGRVGTTSGKPELTQE